MSSISSQSDVERTLEPLVAEQESQAAVQSIDVAFSIESTAPRVRFRELMIALLIVLVWDVVIFRGAGYAGVAVFVLFSLASLAVGHAHREKIVGRWLIIGMLGLVCAKMVWLGSWPHALVAFGLLTAYSCSRSGQTPHVLDVLATISATIYSGLEAIRLHQAAIRKQEVIVARPKVLSVLLPCVACFVFGLIFVLANPNLQRLLAEQFESLFDVLREFLARFSALEFAGWVAVFWVTLSLMRPFVRKTQSEIEVSTNPVQSRNSDLFPAARNTLAALTLLFAMYLVFEFGTLWFREFPAGFHYSGYAHEGAAWLTVALALATACLSLIFRGNMPLDPRSGLLRRLALVWSVENFLLAVSVYNRLSIYVGFNGMTQMRIIGLFGITTVVVGFVLVLCKLVRRHSFLWLVRRQLLAVAFAVFLFLLLPIDMFVVKYNVAQIMSGKLAPAVQISVQKIDDDGLPFLLPLLDCPDDVIRNGVAAFLADRDALLRQRLTHAAIDGWTAFQFARNWADEKLQSRRPAWKDKTIGIKKTQEDWTAFQEYVYRWF